MASSFAAMKSSDPRFSEAPNDPSVDPLMTTDSCAPAAVAKRLSSAFVPFWGRCNAIPRIAASEELETIKICVEGIPVHVYTHFES